MNNLPSSISNDLVENIKSILLSARNSIAKEINQTLLFTYWHIGKEIVEMEKVNKIDATTSRQIILQLSKQLTNEIGKGFSRSNLFNMRRFYLDYESVQTLSGHLNWSHIGDLLIIEDRNKRSFYEQETINARWSVRELKRQIDSSLYERLLLSQGKNNKDKAVEFAQKGQEIAKAEDLLKDPYVFEFLGIPDNKPLLEKDLEFNLIRHIENFLLELGKGFMFVGSQQRITLNNTHYFVDMVFYNKILKSYILIELKTTKLNIADGGQLNTYLNYYKTEINDENDNPPIGLILCAEKDEITAEYILGGFENSVFAAKYITVLPNKELLIAQVKNAIQTSSKLCI